MSFPGSLKTGDFGNSNLWFPKSCWNRRSQVAVGTADLQSAGKPAETKKPAAPIYGGWFRVLSGGSKWVQAQPVGNADQ